MTEGCFAPYTLIHTSNGLESIVDLVGKSGFLVPSYCNKSRSIEQKKVTSVFLSKVNTRSLSVTLGGGYNPYLEIELICTLNHPFGVVVPNSHHISDIMWVQAVDLVEGSLIFSLPPNRHLTVLKVTLLPSTIDSYNMEVEGNHNYFVGSIGTLVHNCSL